MDETDQLLQKYLGLSPEERKNLEAYLAASRVLEDNDQRDKADAEVEYGLILGDYGRDAIAAALEQQAQRYQLVKGPIEYTELSWQRESFGTPLLERLNAVYDQVYSPSISLSISETDLNLSDEQEWKIGVHMNHRKAGFSYFRTHRMRIIVGDKTRRINLFAKTWRLLGRDVHRSFRYSKEGPYEGDAFGTSYRIEGILQHYPAELLPVFCTAVEKVPEIIQKYLDNQMEKIHKAQHSIGNK